MANKILKVFLYIISFLILLDIDANIINIGDQISISNSRLSLIESDVSSIKDAILNHKPI